VLDEKGGKINILALVTEKARAAEIRETGLVLTSAERAEGRATRRHRAIEAIVDLRGGEPDCGGSVRCGCGMVWEGFKTG
jgi:hypothetical protein